MSKPITRTRQEVVNTTNKNEILELINDNNINYVLPTTEEVKTELETKINNIPVFFGTDGKYIKNYASTLFAQSSTTNYSYFRLDISTNPLIRIYSQSTNQGLEISSGTQSNNYVCSISYIKLAYGMFYKHNFYLPKVPTSSLGMFESYYILTDLTYNDNIFSYQHTLTISNGNEFDGLVIKFTEKPTNVKTPTKIDKAQLFIEYIKYIKDVVGYRISNGSVIPCVFTYNDSTLYLNGEEIDVNSLTITDEVVTL